MIQTDMIVNDDNSGKITELAPLLNGFKQFTDSEDDNDNNKINENFVLD